MNDEVSERGAIGDGIGPLISRGGSRVDVHGYARGPVALLARPEHRLMIHAGRPVRGVCSTAQRYSYTRGDIDIVPAGVSDRCVHDDSHGSLHATRVGNHP